jgi:hypothetical protein
MILKMNLLFKNMKDKYVGSKEKMESNMLFYFKRKWLKGCKSLSTVDLYALLIIFVLEIRDQLESR